MKSLQTQLENINEEVDEYKANARKRQRKYMLKKRDEVNERARVARRKDIHNRLKREEEWRAQNKDKVAKKNRKYREKEKQS